MRNRIRGRDHTQVGGFGNTSPPTSATPGSLVAVETVQPGVEAGTETGAAAAFPGAGGPACGTPGAADGGVFAAVVAAGVAGLVDAGGFGPPAAPSPHPVMDPIPSDTRMVARVEKGSPEMSRGEPVRRVVMFVPFRTGGGCEEGRDREPAVRGRTIPG